MRCRLIWVKQRLKEYMYILMDNPVKSKWVRAFGKSILSYT